MEPFISTDDLEAILGEMLTDPSALIVSIALDSACTAVRSYMDQDINYLADDVAVLDGNGRSRIRLPQRPVRAVSAITIDDVAVDAAYFTTRRSIVYLTDDYLTENDGGVFSAGRLNVEITYDHGYDIEPLDSGDSLYVPADIRLVALLAARRVLTAAGATDAVGKKTSETIGNYSYTIPDASVAASAAALLKPEEAVLDRYAIRKAI